MSRGFASLSVFVLFLSTAAFAQSPNDFLNLFGQMVQQGMRVAAQAEWQKLPASETACVDQTLRQQGGSVGELINRGVPPTDPRLFQIVAGCRSQVDQAAEPTAAPTSPYSVDGLALGARVRFDSQAYREYRCEPSGKFSDFTWCHKEKTERTSRGEVLHSNSILHTADGTAWYVNGYVEPAFFTPDAIQNEIDRLSTRFGTRPREVRMPRHEGLGQDATIFIWGNIRLEPLDASDVAAVAKGGDVPGLLVSFLGDVQRSAKAGVPVYRLAGGAGFLWVATYDRAGRGVLRYLTVDDSRIESPATVASSSAQSAPPAPAASAPPNAGASTEGDAIKKQLDEIAELDEKASNALSNKELVGYLGENTVNSIHALIKRASDFRQMSFSAIEGRQDELTSLVNELNSQEHYLEHVADEVRRLRADLQSCASLLSALPTAKMRSQLEGKVPGILTALTTQYAALKKLKSGGVANTDVEDILTSAEALLSKAKELKATADCDAYATSIFDVRGPGVSLDKINPELAIPACETALTMIPDDARTQFQLGRAYQEASATTSDSDTEAKAVAQYERAAEQGYALGQAALGFMYYKGAGVSKDDAVAFDWVGKAAKQGLAPAEYMLGLMLKQGLGNAKNRAGADAWFAKSAGPLHVLANQGYAEAEFMLATLYLNGWGVDRDLGLAVDLYGKAARTDYPGAKELFDRASKLADAQKLGLQYAAESESSWTVSKKQNEMTDRTDVTVRSEQKNGDGAVTEVEGKCVEPGLVVFSALVVDADGNPTVKFPSYSRENQFLWGNGPAAWGILTGMRRINSDVASETTFPDDEFANKFDILVLVDGRLKSAVSKSAQTSAPPSAQQFEEALKALPDVMMGMKLGMTGAEPMETTWRALVEFQSTEGDILLRIPLFDGNVRKLIDSCRASP